MTKKATKAEATKVLNALKKQCRAWLDAGCEGPTLVKREFEYSQGTGWQIIWEGGPYDWVYNFPFGGVEEEFGFRLEDVSDRFDDGVWVEAQNNWSVVIWNG